MVTAKQRADIDDVDDENETDEDTDASILGEQLSSVTKACNASSCHRRQTFSFCVNRVSQET